MTLHSTAKTGAPWSEVALGFAVIFIPSCCLLAIVLAVVALLDARAERRVMETKERNSVLLQSEIIAADFRSIVSDLLVLAEDRTLQGLLSGDVDSDRDALAEVFRLFSSRKRLYDQVRFLDETGQEITRVNLQDGKSYVVTADALQAKADRYYFSDTFRLDRGEVFVSPFDLNVENGEIEVPIKPTIRFGAPVFDRHGNKRGIVILNYLGAALLEKLKAASVNAPGQVMLVNSDGYWLRGRDPSEEWGFMFEERRDRSFAAVYPAAWERISDAKSGQFSTEQGTFTFETISPLSQVQRASLGVPRDDLAPRIASEDYHWKIISFVPRAEWTARSAPYIAVFGVMTAALAVGSWFTARARASHRLAGEALRENEERFRQLAENIDEVFWMTTPDGRQLIYVSPAYEQIWGRSCQSLYDEPTSWLDAVHPEDRDRVREQFFSRPESGDFDVEYRVVRPDGTVRWIWDRGFAVYNEVGEVYRIAGIKEDTTALKQAQQRVLQNERLAAIGEAMAGLTHESRNALQRSQSGLELLARRLQDRPESLELLTEIRKAHHHLHHLYEEVRGYAAPINLKRKPVDVQTILQQAWDHLSNERNGREATLTQVNGAVELDCQVDPLSIEQVFRNILENALSATSEPVTIDVRWSEAELEGRPALRVSIHDNGPGLGGEQAAMIFEPFYTTKVRGTGLGMAICKRIVEAHGGEIAVGANGGSGAEIVVTLPRR